MDCSNCGYLNPSLARFCAECGNSLAIEPEHITHSHRYVEKRLLTVLFCDLVDSTAIVENLGPEQTRSIIRCFQTYSNTVIEQFGGRITEYLGDGIIAQFTRDETNAERAISAALELICKLEEADIKIGTTDSQLQVRCAIATGLAVVGDMLGDANNRSESAIGLPLNLAARIQSLANPNQIVIAGDTYRLSRGIFEFEDMGHHSFKGIKLPCQVWRVIKEKHVSSRFMANAAEMTPMVARDEMMSTLQGHWESSKRGDANTVVLIGEAGIGKSRVLQELAKKVDADDHFYLEYQCAPYRSSTTLYPVISRLEAAAGFEHDDTDVARLVKLEELIYRSSLNFKQDMPAFVSLLGLTAQDKWPAPNFDSDERKEWIFKSMIGNIFSLAKTKPLLIKIEDIHWIDPTTLELVNRLIKELSEHQILIVITSRPGFETGFMQKPHVRLLEIYRLTNAYTAKLIAGVKGADKLTKEEINEIIRRTEGIPLFIEELCKNVMESMVLNTSSARSGLLAKKHIPMTLHDSLLSRLDRLPKASRAIAQLAAVIGREFSFDLLERVANYKNITLRQDLTPLLESQLIYQYKPSPYTGFAFKHSLVRDVVYENLLQSEKVDIHQRVAQVIEQSYPEIIKNTPEVLAWHFAEGKNYEKAVQYWLKAGKKASESAANIEARNLIDNGIKVINQLPIGTNRNELELSLLVALGQF